VLSTLETYNAAARYLASHTISAEELKAAVVGAIGELDAYLLPDAKGSAAFSRILTGDTAELRQQLRDEIFGTQAGHFREFGQALEAFTRQGRVCALGGSGLERVAREKGWHREHVL
jgi:Zn-dependent M16 (insulinase) family peptidase